MGQFGRTHFIYGGHGGTANKGGSRYREVRNREAALYDTLKILNYSLHLMGVMSDKFLQVSPLVILWFYDIQLGGTTVCIHTKGIQGTQNFLRILLEKSIFNQSLKLENGKTKCSKFFRNSLRKNNLMKVSKVLF